VKKMMEDLESGRGADPVDQAIAEVRAASQRRDLVDATAAQERVVSLMRERGQAQDGLFALTIQLVNLATFYSAADRYADASKLLEEALAIGESIHHPHLINIREWLANTRELAAMSPAERAQLKAEQNAAEEAKAQEEQAAEAEMEAQLAAMPPEQRAQVEAAMREFESKSPEEQAAIVQRVQIQGLADQVRDAAIAARRGQVPRDQLVPQLEQLVAQIEQEQPEDSPWGQVAAFVRAVVVLLRGRTSLILVPGQPEAPLPPVPAVYAAHLAAAQQAHP
jgi:hypothetical protein